MPSKRHSAGRRLGLAAVAALVLVVAAAAAGASQAAPARVSGSAAKDVLIVDNVFNNKNLDPQREASLTANMALRGMYDTLLTFKGSDTTPVAAVASAWKISDDARSIVFTLRKDIKFSDGTPLTAKDVVFSYARLVNLKGSMSFLLKGLQLRAKGQYTVILLSDTPNPALLRIVENPALSIVNRKQVAAAGGTAAVDAAKTDKAEEWFSSNSAGSGPYMLKAFVPAQQITLVANPKYWGSKPRFKTVVIRNMPSPTQFLNVQRGENEIAYDVPAALASTLKSSKKVQVVTGPGTATFFINVNMKPGITSASNPHILNAIRYGLDYDALIKLGGPGSVRLPGMVPVGFLGSLPQEFAIKRDLAKAKAEIVASGIKDPGFELAYIPDFSFAGVSLTTLAQKIQESLVEAGLKVTIAGYPFGPYLEKRRNGTLGASVSLFGADYPDPNNYLTFAPGGNSATGIFWPATSDPAGAALAARAQSEPNDKKRAALFVQLQKHLNEVSPFIPEFQPAAVLVGSANLTGVVTNPVWGLDVAGVGAR